MSNLNQSDISKAQKSDLIQSLGTTVMGSMEARKAIIDELQKQLSKSSIGIPTFQYFRKNMFPAVDSELTGVYERVMEGLGIDTDDISNPIKVVQGALFDSIMFVYDKAKGTYCLATMNLDLLTKLGAKLPTGKTIINANKQNAAKAFRIDVSYSSEKDDLIYKAVQAKDFAIDEVKSDKDETKRFTLVPYHFVEQLIEAIAGQLEKGKIIQVAQTVGGMKKVRFITKNVSVLKAYCDDPSAVVTDARYFTDLGFFYAPSVGASSLTAMVTNIRVFDIDSMSLFADGSILEKKGITKPASPMRDLLGEGIVCGVMAQYLKSGDNKFNDVCNSLSYSKRLIKDADKVSVASIAKYLHSVPAASREKAYNLCGVKEHIDDLEAYFSNMITRPLSPKDDIKELLKRAVIRVVIQKEKDCRLSSIFCTNSKEILTKVYGPNYARLYESFASCFYSFYNWIKNKDIPIKEETAKMLSFNGLLSDDETVAKVLQLHEANKGRDVHEEYLKKYLAEKMGVDVNRSTSSSNAQSNSIMVRTITAFLDYDNKPYNYYRYIDPTKIVRGTVFELRKGKEE